MLLSLLLLCLSMCAGNGLDLPPYVLTDPVSGDLILPDLDTTVSVELAELKDAVRNEGLLAYYVSLCLTNTGTE